MFILSIIIKYRYLTIRPEFKNDSWESITAPEISKENIGNNFLILSTQEINKTDPLFLLKNTKSLIKRDIII
jgi:hypothetical protein